MSPFLRVAPVCPPAPICRALERIEAASAHSQHLAAPEKESKRLGLRTQQYGSATAILMRKSTNLYYNRLIAWGQASSATPGQLDRFIAFAWEHRAEAVGVSVGAGARPQQLREWLEERAFESGHPSAKLWRDASPLPRNSDRDAANKTGRRISVRRVRRADAAAWVDVVGGVWRAFGSRRPWFEARALAPGWRHYLAWVDGEPVAAGGLFVGSVGGRTVGHLVDGVTSRRWRKQGAQSAIIRRRISDGVKLGCELFSVETAPPLPGMPLVSFRNLRRQGFELAYLREAWKLQLR